jgi:murE/murF fusion protein
MNKKGEIGNLSKIIQPETAIITNISEAHLENFNSIKDIAKAKSEIIGNILEGGNIILNKDSNFFSFLSNQAKKNGINVISFSLKKRSDIFLLNTKKIGNYYRLKLKVKNKIFNFDVKYSADNFINNFLACICVLFVYNLNLDKMKKKFINFKIPDGRGDIKIIKKFNKRFEFIDESYNANPLSMTSAIKNMNFHKRKNNGKKLVFLGDMLELGKRSTQLHRTLSNTINKSNVDKVFVYGKYIRETFDYLHANKKGKIFDNLREARNHFAKIIRNNDLLMVKGSNATGLNRFSKNIKRGQISAI